MDVSLVPSLEHLTCVKIVTLLLDGYELRWGVRLESDRIKHEITEKISKIVPCDILRRKVEGFIAPLLRETENWKQFCEKTWPKPEYTVHWPIDRVPHCWLPDGTIDSETFMNTLFENSDISPLNRFTMACIFCRFEEVLDSWNSLLWIEKGYIQNRSLTNDDVSYFVIRHWIEWLQSSTDKDWKSFVAWALETPVWKSNLFMLKRVLQTLSPIDKGHYLLKALTGGKVSSDMRFGLSILSRDDREVVFRESPLEVFKCILCWPLKCIFSDFANGMWPFVTQETFCPILVVMMKMIDDEKTDYAELLIIVQTFWAQSPYHFKKFAEKHIDMFKTLNMVLKYDFSEPFQKNDFTRLILQWQINKLLS